MTTMKRTILLVFLGLLLLSAGSASVARAADDRPLDIVVVIDNSGSMGENDPTGLRYQAALMLIDLLGDRDRIAFVTFSTSETALNPTLLLPSSPQQRRDLQSTVAAAHTNEGATNYGLALSAAYELLGGNSGNQQAVIFLTDGEPTDDLSDIDHELKRFGAAGIPVYLMLLNTAGYAEVNAAFEATGPARIELGNSLDIGRAFAFALTDLQPTTYLDALEGTAGTGSAYTFMVDAGLAQKVAEATFVFLPAPGATSPVVTVSNQPDNAELRNQPGGGSYTVYSYRSSDAGAISGNWQFSSNSKDVSAFAFIRSEIDLQIRAPALPPPGRQRGVMNGLPFVLGASAVGGDVSSATVSARFSPGESCFAASGMARSGSGDSYDLNPVGLSEDSSLFWRRFETGLTQPMLVNIELKQLDRPLRLSRCFVLWPVTPTADALIIDRPTANDAPVDGAIPIVVTLASSVEWQRATGFVQEPNGHVGAVALGGSGDSWRGSFDGITTGGAHTIRVLALGVVDGADVAAYVDTVYLVEGGMSLAEDVLDMGEISELGQSFVETINLETLLLEAGAGANFSLGAVRDAESQTDASQWVTVDVCPATEVEGDDMSCKVAITPNVALPPGVYEVEVHIAAEGATLNKDRFTFRFTRPPSQIRLLSELLPIGVATPADRVLEAPLQFKPVIWSGDPELPSEPVVRELRNVDTREVFNPPANYLTVELMLADPAQLTYQLILSVDPVAELPQGNYEAVLQLPSAVPNLLVEPNPLVLSFSKLAAYATTDFTEAKDYDQKQDIVDMSGPVWGMRWLNRLLGYQTYATVPLQTYYMTGFPDPLVPPVVEQVKVAGEETTVPVDAFHFQWRNDGPVDGRPDLFKATLVAAVTEAHSVKAGDYDVRLRMQPPLTEPTTQTVRMTVQGWGAFFWWRFLPIALTLAGVVLLVSMVNVRARPRLTGKLVIAAGGSPETFPLTGSEALLMADMRTQKFVVVRPGSESTNYQRLATITPLGPGKIELNFHGYGTVQLISGVKNKGAKIWYR